MPPTVRDVLATQKGLVIAPAGCGKTQLIVDTLQIPNIKPTLVLTHTTAGVAAIRHRLNRLGVPRSQYRLATIAGWALSIVSMFPERSGFVLDPVEPPQYSKIQQSVATLIEAAHIDDLLVASYARLLVDEYQDCSITQHKITSAISRILPTVVFGDPMQAIFNFNRKDPLPRWDEIVCDAFPKIGELTVPWRWKNAGAEELGRWILYVRDALFRKVTFDMRAGGKNVRWCMLTNDENRNIKKQVGALHDISRDHQGETLLIVGDSKNVESRHRYARNTTGVGVVEPVDLRDVVSRAELMSEKQGADLLNEVVDFLRQVMVNVYADRLLARVNSIRNRTNTKPPTEQEAAAVRLADGGGHKEAHEFMKSMCQDPNRRVFRESAFRTMFDALSAAAARPDKDLHEIAAAIREQRRHAGRRIPYKAVGSTLLLKGLEADHVLILDAGQMDSRHLYVALSRGAKSVTIFSRSPFA